MSDGRVMSVTGYSLKMRLSGRIDGYVLVRWGIQSVPVWTRRYRYGLDPATDQAITGLKLVNATATGIYHNTTATRLRGFPTSDFTAVGRARGAEYEYPIFVRNFYELQNPTQGQVFHRCCELD